MSEPIETNAGSFQVFRTLVRRPVTLLVTFATLLLVGFLAYARIPVQMMPDGLTHPGLEIFVLNPGASAPENEEKVARVIEETMRTLPDVEDIYSGSGEDTVWVYVQFKSDVDMDLAKAEVRDRIERARPQLPDTVSEVSLWSWSQDSMPIMWLSILTPGDSDRTDYLMDSVVKRRLEGVEGVGRVEIHGVLADSVRILLDEERVLAANLNLGSLIGRLMQDNFAMPMGEVGDGGRRILLRADMRFGSIEEIENYPVGNGLVISDLGEVIRAKAVRENLYRIDGAYSYYAEVHKESQANVVQTCENVQAALEELGSEGDVGDELSFLVLFDQGEFINSSLDQLRNTAMWGGGLALVVLLIFLRRFRLTLCVALSIPVSALLAVAWTYFSGGTFNVLTMTGITLAIGMLVDNSVVVIENIARVRAEGKSASEAAVEGVGEVGLAVFLATMTSVVVFLPLIFMTENPVMRIMFGQLGFPLCIALIFSLLVALVFLPVASIRVVGPRHPLVERAARFLTPLGAVPARLVAYAIGGTRAAIWAVIRVTFAVNRLLLSVLAPVRWLVAAGLVALIAFEFRSLQGGASVAEHLGTMQGSPTFTKPLTVAFVVAGAIGVTMILFFKRWNRRPKVAPRLPSPLMPSGSSILDFSIAGNRSLVAWSLRHRVLASFLALLALASVFIPQNNMEVAAFGEDENSSRIDMYVDLEENFTLSEASDELSRYEVLFEEKREEYGYEHIGTRFSSDGGRISLYWEDSQDPDYMADVRKDMRSSIPRLPGHDVRFRGEDENSATRNRNLVAFDLRGPNSEELQRIGERAVKILEKIPGLHSISSSAQSAPEQIRVVFDSELSQRMGVSTNDALQNIAWALRGWSLPRLQEPGREVPLYIEYDEEQIAGLDTLKDLQIFNGESVVPLASIASLEFARGADSIRRKNGQATLTITGRLEDPSMQGKVTLQGYQALTAMDMPRGYSVAEEDLVINRQEEEMKELQSALMLSIVLVFLLMGILFESFILPFSVLFTIPFAYVGSMWTLYLTGTVMDSVGWIGIIILVGVVVNNGIVLIDRIHRIRKEGMERNRAVVEGCGHRVRPILMTALTTVCGLLPMALSNPPSEGIDYRALATCVAGGLTFSTLFTLWVVPLAYTILDDMGRVAASSTSAATRPLRKILVARA